MADSYRVYDDGGLLRHCFSVSTVAFLPSGNNQLTITFPVAFPSVCLFCSVSLVDQSFTAVWNGPGVMSFTRSSCRVVMVSCPGANVRIFAIGY